MHCNSAVMFWLTGVARDPLALVENLDRLVRDAHIDEFTDKSIAGGIPMAVDLYMIIGCDRNQHTPIAESAALPCFSPENRDIFQEKQGGD